MVWTEQQQKTIDVRGRNILVSAAAGSGKTAVLVERIEKMVTEEKVPIDKMLIVTFTNAAASEMREKIRRALKEKVREKPELRSQLELMLTVLPEYEVVYRGELARVREDKKTARLCSLDLEEDQALHDFVWKRMNYSYPFVDAGQTRSKYSVSSLNQESHAGSC